jgi:hypothetical protein
LLLQHLITIITISNIILTTTKDYIDHQNDASYVKNIKINDVDRHSPHLLKVTLIRNNHNGNTPNYISVVALGNEDKHLAGSITISSHFTDQKTVTVHLLKKNGHNANIDNSNDVTVFVVPATLSIHH